MAFDAHKNLAVGTVLTPPSPPASGTTILVNTGEGARFPAAPFNVTVWPVSQMPAPSTAEVLRVTAKLGDTFTVARAQEGTVARTILAGDLIAETITAKALTDIESGTNFPLITTPGTVTSAAAVVSGNVSAGTVSCSGALTAQSATLNGGDLTVNTAAGVVGAATGAQSIDVGKIAFSPVLRLWGNTSAGLGVTQYIAPTVAGGGTHEFYTAGTKRWTLGADGHLLAGTVAHGQSHTLLQTDGILRLGTYSAGTFNQVLFSNPNGFIGSIVTSGSTTTYNTTSDARLKRDQGLATETSVLARTKVHDFTWRIDGTAGRGVFAQEALSVLPAAVTVGQDVSRPWGVDYAKYVPDLIVGWQDHEARLAALEATRDDAPASSPGRSWPGVVYTVRTLILHVLGLAPLAPKGT